MHIYHFLSVSQIIDQLECVAVSPNTYSLNNLGLNEESRLTSERLGRLAPTVIKYLNGLGGMTTKDRHRLTRCMARLIQSDQCGRAKQILQKGIQNHEIELPKKVNASPKLDPSKLNAKECQVILSAISAERIYMETCQRHLIEEKRSNSFDQHLTSKSNHEIVENSDAAQFLFPIPFLQMVEDPQLFSLFLGHPHSTINGVPNFKAFNSTFIEKLTSLIESGELSKGGKESAILLVRWYERSRSVGRANNFVKASANPVLAFHRLLKFSPYVASSAPYGKELSAIQLKFTEHEAQLTKLGINTGKSYPDNYINQVLTIWDRYLEDLPNTEATYKAVWQKLQDLKPDRSKKIDIRKAYLKCTKQLVGDSALFPTPEQFQRQWSCEAIAPKKVTKKKAAPKRKKKKNKKKSVSPKPANGFTYASRVNHFLFLEKPAGSRSKNEIEHGFALTVDKYVKDLGVKSTWVNPNTGQNDILFSIPGEIEFKGKKKRGLFTYCFDESKPNHCYHRCFMKKAADEMIQEYATNSYWEVDFPPLGSKETVDYKSNYPLAADSSQTTKNGALLVEIEDPQNDSIIRLFKLKQ